MDIHKVTVPIFVITVVIIIGSVFTTKYHESQIIHVYIPTVIHDNQESNYLLKELKDAKTGDEVIVHINSRGGDEDVGGKIQDAIKTSKAKIVGEVDGIAASAGCDIMLSCPKLHFDNVRTSVLFHVSRCFYIIDDSGVKHYVGNPDKLPVGLQDKVKIEFSDENSPDKRDVEMLPIYKQILTQDEMIKVFVNHEDLWLSGTDVATRLKALGRDVTCDWKQ